MPTKPLVFLNNTQRKVVRKYLARKDELNESVPFTKISQHSRFRGIELSHLKNLIKNEERCIRDEERRKEVLKRKELQVEEEKKSEQQAQKENFQVLVTTVIQKDKQLKEFHKELHESQHAIKEQQVIIQEIQSRCEQSYKMVDKIEHENSQLEKYLSKAEKERVYFEDCLKEWQVEYDRLKNSMNSRISSYDGHDSRDYYELKSQLQACWSNFDSIYYMTSIEKEFKATVELLKEKDTQGKIKRFMTMGAMRKLVIREGTRLKKEKLIPYFDDNAMFYRAEDYWTIRNKMAHEHRYIYEMDHKKFQEDAKWLYDHLRDFQNELRRLLEQNKFLYI